VSGSEAPSRHLRLGIAWLAAIACLAGGCVSARLRAEFTRGDYALLTSPAMHGTNPLAGGATDPERAGPCTAVVAGGRIFVVDGPGAWEGYDWPGCRPRALGRAFTTFLPTRRRPNEALMQLDRGPPAAARRTGRRARRASSPT
jgi:hypothetical protein